MKHAGQAGPGASVRHDVAIFVELDLAHKRLCIRNVADCDEETIDVAPIAFAGLQVPKRDTSDRLLADVMDFIDYRVSDHLDLRVGDSAVNHDLRCPECVSSMN